MSKMVWATILLVTSCSHYQALIVTGESMDAMATTFVATASAMDNALDRKAITPEAYQKWATFGAKFQEAYPLAINLWQVAEANKDEASMKELTSMLSRLSFDLGSWASVVGVK